MNKTNHGHILVSIAIVIGAICFLIVLIPIAAFIGSVLGLLIAGLRG